jgi:hypothetical protein
MIHSIGPKPYFLRRFGPIHYNTKVGAQLAEHVPLTHKFAKRNSVRLFRNERTQSTPLDTKLMFWAVSNRFDTS